MKARFFLNILFTTAAFARQLQSDQEVEEQALDDLKSDVETS